MDQQQDMKLDVKEAAAVPSDHPQWDLSDTDDEHRDEVSDELRDVAITPAWRSTYIGYK